MLLTLSFKIMVIFMLLSNLVNYFEKYFPPQILRTLRFGRASIGIPSKALVFEVPKSWFTLFYVFAAPFSALTLYAYCTHQETLRSVFEFLLGYQPCIPNSPALLVNCLLVFQTFRRLYECLVISKFSGDARMNVLIFLIGLWHYFGATVSIYGGGDEGCSHLSVYSTICAILIFVFASVKQFEAHSILGSLRNGPNDKSYKIPVGGLFEYVSCANYFCEILIYLSFCLIFGFQNTAFNWVAAWVTSNQVYSAIMSHNWYVQKFGSSYPTHRKILIPYVF